MGLLGDWDSDQAKCADGYWQPRVASDTVALWPMYLCQATDICIAHYLLFISSYSPFFYHMTHKIVGNWGYKLWSFGWLEDQIPEATVDIENPAWP